jgi:23S rRNA (pseudouridine1915-N3)-methyltransferase
MIFIVDIGKQHEDWVLVGIERYGKRLRPPFDANWVLLPHSSFEADRARQEESERIRKQVDDSSFVILLDERGKRIGTPALGVLLERQFTASRRVTFIIGGAYGVSDELRGQAGMVLSLSDMVFPHQLVRLILTEQLYRVQEIIRGGKYHHS